MSIMTPKLQTMVSVSAIITLSLLSILPAALAVKAGIILPLYIYPGDQAASWDPIVTQIQNYPDVRFDVIANPNSGPRPFLPPPSPQDPDPNYVYGIQRLKSYDNVRIYGYVPVNYTARAITEVEKDLDLWRSLYGTNVTGVFFDEVNITVGSEEYMQQVTAYAVNTDGFDPAQIVFNSGTPAPKDSVLYSTAAQVVIAENDYSKINTSVVEDSGASQNQISVILYNGVTSEVNEEVIRWCGLVYDLFITDRTLAQNPYNATGGQWDSFVAAINACPS